MLADKNLEPEFLGMNPRLSGFIRGKFDFGEKTKGKSEEHLHSCLLPFYFAFSYAGAGLLPVIGGKIGFSGI